MKFIHNGFSCDVGVYRSGRDIVVRFCHLHREQSAKEICDLVIVDPGLGYLSLKFKGEEGGLLSGFLDADFFPDDAIVDAAVAFIESLSPDSDNAYIPHHIARFRRTSFVEYNGEY